MIVLKLNVYALSLNVYLQINFCGYDLKKG